MNFRLWKNSWSKRTQITREDMPGKTGTLFNSPMQFLHPISNSRSTTNVIGSDNSAACRDQKLVLFYWKVMTRRYMLLHRCTKLQCFEAFWLTSGATIVLSLLLLQMDQLCFYPKLGVAMHLTKKYTRMLISWQIWVWRLHLSWRGLWYGCMTRLSMFM